MCILQLQKKLPRSTEKERTPIMTNSCNCSSTDSFQSAEGDDFSHLRKQIFVMLIDQSLFPAKGAMVRLAGEVSAYCGRTISRQLVSMALTGYRTFPASRQLLQEIKKYLEKRSLTVSHNHSVRLHYQKKGVKEKVVANDTA
jgi:hypothetical protein